MNIEFSQAIRKDLLPIIVVQNQELDTQVAFDLTIPQFEKTLYVHSTQNALLIKCPEKSSIKEIGGLMMQAIIAHKIENALIIPPKSCEPNMIDFFLGIQLASYRFNHYFKNPTSVPPESITVYETPSAQAAYTASQPLALGVSFCRDLVSEPSNILSPEAFKNRIVEKLEPLGVKLTILDEKDILSLGMNALHGVARGSAKPPFVVAMHWQGSDEAPIAIAGKGVCFDTGGISLKPSLNMHDMKYDMGGAGTVTGLMYTLAKRKAKANVVGIVGLVENMPDGNAQNPGDVVTSMSGQTIEVLNTDAEGRLVLADVLTYVQKEYQPKTIIDLATLTGAVVVALGNQHAGLFSNHTELANHLYDSGQKTGEPVWQLPIGPEYDKQLDSDIADMQNIGKKGAGSITAAQFIGRFIENDTPWAHFDIAGMAWADQTTPITPKGATGFGVTLLNDYIQSHHE